MNLPLVHLGILSRPPYSLRVFPGQGKGEEMLGTAIPGVRLGLSWMYVWCDCSQVKPFVQIVSLPNHLSHMVPRPSCAFWFVEPCGPCMSVILYTYFSFPSFCARDAASSCTVSSTARTATISNWFPATRGPQGACPIWPISHGDGGVRKQGHPDFEFTIAGGKEGGRGEGRRCSSTQPCGTI